MAKWSPRSHARLMCGAASAALLLCASGAHAQTSGKVEIAPQPLASALNQFGVQTGHQVIFAPALTGEKTTRGVSTDGSIELALAQLLDGSGLGYRRDGDTFLIVRASDPQSGSAAGDGADNGTVQALIVTAQKREEDIQDVPIAISAFTQEDLTRSQVAGGPDLVTQVPNFTFTKTNFSSYSIQIRGIGTQAISATTDPAVAVAFNNTPFIRNRFFEQEFYDLERVEVLRGPQGTLYGRNATAGVVNIISAKPKFRYEAKLSGDLGNFSSSRLEGMVNIPLVEDKVALRIAGAWTKRDGYVTNEITSSQTDGRDLWSTRVSLRVQPTDRLNVNLIWEHFQEDDDRLRSGKQLCKKDVVDHIGSVPITNYYDTSIAGGQSGAIWAGVQAGLSQGCTRLSLYDNQSFQRPNGLMLPYYVPLGAIGLPIALTDPYVSTVNSSDPAVISATNDQPQDLRVIQSTIDPVYRAKNDLGELQVSFDLTDHLTLSSETAYAKDFVYSLQDFNRFNTAPGAWRVRDTNGNLTTNVERGILSADGAFCDPQLGCSDRLVAVDISTARARQFSQEFRLSSDFDGAFNFSLGANYLRADSEDKYYVFLNSISLIAAITGGGDSFFSTRPYVGGVTDNTDCMLNGYAPGDPNGVYPVTNCVYMDPNPIGSVNDQGHNYFLSKNPYKLISYAVFGEAYYKIADNLKLTAGLRWTVDKKDAPRIPTWILGSASIGYPVAEVIRQEWRKPSGRLTLDWKPDLSFTDETLLYASFARGYKAGGANPPGFVRGFYADSSVALDQTAASATRPRTFDPEYVNAYELGSKNTFADGRATLNLAAFYYDYTGYQVSEIVDRSAFNRNFDAKVWGAELEADWRPLENLRLGFKGGYEKTRIDDSERAIDLMDRTAGDPNWILVRPFPTYASSCILPTYVFVNPDGTIGRVGGVGGGGPSGCEIAYTMGLDPVTEAPYVDLNTTPPPPSQGIFNNLGSHPDYPGFDPSTAPNHGEGIMKPLGGNELPNAPHFTATVTGDYTVPLPSDWLMTLHSDVHWQSQSWWRVFNDNAYDKLHPYFTMNLAAIFTNEEQGWNIMAYIKNVTDETAITGAFLNSDDTGLTTNVFLTEPRLYGLRVTKAWTGGPLLGNFGARHDGPYPFTVELGGQIQRQDAPNAVLQPSFASAFSGPFDLFDEAQNDKLDWGDGREAKLTWRSGASPWSVSAGVRFGKTNGHAARAAEQRQGGDCVFGAAYSYLCAYYVARDPQLYQPLLYAAQNDRVDASAVDREKHTIADFAVGRDFGFGGLGHSTLSAGLRFAKLDSRTDAELKGVPDWNFPDGFYLTGDPVTHTVYRAEINARREFKGFGPVIDWDASLPLLDLHEGGRVDADWSLSAGVLRGNRKTAISEHELERDYVDNLLQLAMWTPSPLPVLETQSDVTLPRRSSSATVPVYGASLGLSYSVGGFTAGAGYRWERYVNAIDGGFTEERSEDRTIDGPYFKVSVGFGG